MAVARTRSEEDFAEPKRSFPDDSNDDDDDNKSVLKMLATFKQQSCNLNTRWKLPGISETGIQRAELHVKERTLQPDCEQY